MIVVIAVAALYWRRVAASVEGCSALKGSAGWAGRSISQEWT